MDFDRLGNIFTNLDRRQKIFVLLGLFLLFTQPQIIFTVMIIAFILMVFGQTRDNDNVAVPRRRYEYDARDNVPTLHYRRGQNQSQPERRTQPPRPVVYDHALEAVRNAGRDPDHTPVLPVDIGVLTYRGSEEPRIVRDWRVPDDVDYIQPFVQLRLPRPAEGAIRFEIVDASGEPLLIHTEEHDFQRGRNLIVPTVRLPVHDEQTISEDWELRVSVGDILLAKHRVEWQSAHIGEPSGLEGHIGADGELSSELRAVLAENRLQTMSLDDLLGDQEDEAPTTYGRRTQ